MLQKAAGPDQRATPASRLSSFEYRYLTEFQSHEPEFDYLKSLEIEEKINKVKWCRTSCGSRMLLSTNDKTIKLWRVNLEAEVLCILHLSSVRIMSQVWITSNKSGCQHCRLETGRFAHWPTLTLETAHITAGQLLLGMSPCPVVLLMQLKSVTLSFVQLQHAALLHVRDIAILGGTVRPSVHECRNTGANGSAARQKLAASTEHRLKSAENLRMPKVPMGICHLSHTPAWALCALHWSCSFNPSGLICRVHPFLLQLSTWLLSTDLLSSVMY